MNPLIWIKRFIDAIQPAPPAPSAPEWKPTLAKLPTCRKEVYDIFGNPGDVELDPKWEQKNILNKVLMPGVPNKMRVNYLAEPYFREAFSRATKFQKVGQAGCFNYRHERHNPNLLISYHSWGIAVDIDPDKNKAVQFTKANPKPKPWSPEWMKIWPEGLTKEFVDAFCSVGFVWGGYWPTFADNMHFQLGVKV